MINLLPEQVKDSITYARRNTVLKNWVLAGVVAVLGIVIILAAGNLFIKMSVASSEKQSQTIKEQLKAQKLEETQARVTEISDSVKLATQVLSKQVSFSKLLTQVGAAIPVGSSLQSLNINSIEGGIDLTAVATNYQTATQVQINLSDPENKIFEKADIVSITCGDANKDMYPCTVTIRALFAKDNVFQYKASKVRN
jgi:Tfp pilus assembly protein PilN